MTAEAQRVSDLDVVRDLVGFGVDHLDQASCQIGDKDLVGVGSDGDTHRFMSTVKFLYSAKGGRIDHRNLIGCEVGDEKKSAIGADGSISGRVTHLDFLDLSEAHR